MPDPRHNFFDLYVQQQLHGKPSTSENFLLGAVAAAGSVSVMIPMDTIKTRLVTQVRDGPHFAISLHVTFAKRPHPL